MLVFQIRFILMIGVDVGQVEVHSLLGSVKATLKILILGPFAIIYAFLGVFGFGQFGKYYLFCDRETVRPKHSNTPSNFSLDQIWNALTNPYP